MKPGTLTSPSLTVGSSHVSVSVSVSVYYSRDIPGSDIIDALCIWSGGSGYADDNAEWRSFFKSEAAYRIALREIQNYLNQLAQWGSRWRLLPSPTKTEAMIFSPPLSTNRNREIDLYLYGQKIKTVKEVRFLGAVFDQGLTWSSHIDKLIQKATPRSIQICRLARTLRGLDNVLVGQLINALIISIFDYSLVAWVTASDAQWKKISQCQMRTLKALLGVPRRTSDDAVMNRINTGTYREIISARVARRFESINKGSENMAKFQSRCVVSDRNHRQRSAYEILTELSKLDETLISTKCIVCTYSPDNHNDRLRNYRNLNICHQHRSTQASRS